MFEKNGLLRHVNKLLRNLFTVPRNDEVPLSFLVPFVPFVVKSIRATTPSLT
jgi:hypothetical protein